MDGNTVQVVKFGKDNEVTVDADKLDTMFSHPDVRHRKVVAFSIIGAFRTGKSFFLDYCLRYLYANYKSIKKPTQDVTKKHWMGSETEALTGFSWRAGTKRDTTGIIMWDDIFLHTMETTGEKIAIVVMDTQGLFDTETSPLENSRIFATSTLISSIQILNLTRRVQEDQLQYLQFATEFAKFSANDSPGSGAAPFQDLIFLIRDWENQEEYELGDKGGAEYLKEVLQMKDGQIPELKSVRESISTSFETIECFLMSYPGKNVAGSKNYNGQWGLMDEEFKDILVTTVEKLLSSENLTLKKINGDALKSSEFKEYVKSVSTLFHSGTQPLAKSMYDLVIEQQMKILIDKCVNLYEETLAASKNMWTEDNLDVFHTSSCSKALEMFKKMKKMGSSSHKTKYKAQLEAVMQKMHSKWRDQTLKSLKEAREEKAKVEKALEEKRLMERKASEAARIAKAKQEELDREKQLRKLEEQKYESQRELELRSLKLKQEELNRERQLRKLEEQKFETQRKELELRSLAMSRPSPSRRFDMSDMFQELQSASFRSYSGPSYAAPSMSARMQCQGTTLQGRQCRNMARPGSSRCHHNH